MNIEDMISAVQKKVGVQVDGRAGTKTWGAIYSHIVKPTIEGGSPSEAISLVDSRSEKYIATLLPEVQPIARALVQKAGQNGIRIKVISGLRTYTEQDELYAQGRTTTGPKVTNARGGHSNHNFGIAFDIGVFEGTKYLGESQNTKLSAYLEWIWGLSGAGTGKPLLTSLTSSFAQRGRRTSPKGKCWQSFAPTWKMGLPSMYSNVTPNPPITGQLSVTMYQSKTSSTAE